MIEVKLVKLVLKLRDLVCKRALKSINKKSQKNLVSYNGRHQVSAKMHKNLLKYDLDTELDFTARENVISSAYDEVTKLATK